MCGIKTFINGANNFYCLHQIFCNNKHPQWNHAELNDLKNYISNEFPDLSNHELYKIIKLT